MLDRIKKECSIDEGETTPDLAMTLETVGCIGCCGLAPVATVNEDIVGEIDMKKLDSLVDKIKKGEDISSSDDDD